MLKAALVYVSAVLAMSVIHVLQVGVESTSAHSRTVNPDMVVYPELEEQPAALPAIIVGYEMIPELQSI